MRTTVNLDEELLARAQAITGETERGELLHEALRALIEREAARRLSRLSGSMPGAQDIPRRRGE
ncbi:type II toxin-antitoxin system VapB family antitoxin [Glaciimonas immobilis]|uniref:Arc/MetJ family transcription regulator n=1 Tax=Glaciimonas immobilis TaxID=728004 RepID=A0A840RZP2_9BURK|nr:type II toxin-antitoxin system VapB family antitoxin [Glaciimonas immobilis]KAF3998402.1 type II toxin-antitoxin system VapB family antitoxin [Glaciimonas immobilis]MBB5202114.1 Arc/MetJ family transcription regulator [Glaciimonas immobilis]